MSYVNYDTNCQIWVFVNDHVQSGIISDSDQRLTLYLTLKDEKQLMTTAVYAKCSAKERLNLWDDLYNLSNNFLLP